MIVDVPGIPLRRRDGSIVYALVDPCDFVAVNDFRWHLSAQGYVKRETGTAGQGKKSFYLHREILGLAPDDPRQVDHKNRNRLDNRRSNLRAVTAAENAQNRGHQTGRFRGVARATHGGTWLARVQIKGVVHYLGRFATEDEAGHAAAAFRREHMPFSFEDAAA